jgi:ParB family chromosome partitioning protein
MAEKKLGRGLDFLISEDSTLPSDEVLELDIDSIFPNPQQPRREFDPTALQELADSIRQNGVLQPVVVRQVAKGYELIAGERRWRASRIAGLETIPAIVRAVDDAQLLELALIENVQREDLNAIEKARAYREMIQRLGLTQEQVASKVGKDRSSVANLVRLLDLPSEVQDCVSRGSLTMGHARALLGLKSPSHQSDLCKRIIRDALNVRETEREVTRLQAASASARPSPEAARSGTSPVPDAQVKDLEDQLRRAVGLRSKLRVRGPRTRVIIDCPKPSDFERLFIKLTGSKPIG